MGECHVHKGIRARDAERGAGAPIPTPKCWCTRSAAAPGQLIYEMGHGDIGPRGPSHHLDRGDDPRGRPSARRRSSSSPPRPGSCTACAQMAPGQAVHRGGPRGGLRLHEGDHAHRRARFARAGPVSHHRPSRHRAARPRGDRPHGGAGPVTAETPSASPPSRSAEDGATRHHHARSPCPPASPAEGRIEYRSGGVARRHRVRRRGGAGLRLPHRMARAGGSHGAGRATVGASSAGRSARILRAERPLLNLLQRAIGHRHRDPRVRGRRGRAPAAGSSTPGRPRRGFGRSTSPPCWPAGAPATAPTSRMR